MALCITTGIDQKEPIILETKDGETIEIRFAGKTTSRWASIAIKAPKSVRINSPKTVREKGMEYTLDGNNGV